MHEELSLPQALTGNNNNEKLYGKPRSKIPQLRCAKKSHTLYKNQNSNVSGLVRSSIYLSPGRSLRGHRRTVTAANEFCSCVPFLGPATITNWDIFQRTVYHLAVSRLRRMYVMMGTFQAFPTTLLMCRGNIDRYSMYSICDCFRSSSPLLRLP